MEISASALTTSEANSSREDRPWSIRESTIKVAEANACSSLCDAKGLSIPSAIPERLGVNSFSLSSLSFASLITLEATATRATSRPTSSKTCWALFMHSTPSFPIIVATSFGNNSSSFGLRKSRVSKKSIAPLSYDAYPTTEFCEPPSTTSIFGMTAAVSFFVSMVEKKFSATFHIFASFCSSGVSLPKSIILNPCFSHALNTLVQSARTFSSVKIS
mmetsp:Transcript_14991/g.21377  ORF Transcript_14991/g.21377 Transcript_14991/m.21377 type:complete len:217 (-) Transcript_14991:1042-1692(-)